MLETGGSTPASAPPPPSSGPVSRVVIVVTVAGPPPVPPVAMPLTCELRREFFEADTVVVVCINPAEDGGDVPARLVAEWLEAFELVPIKV